MRDACVARPQSAGGTKPADWGLADGRGLLFSCFIISGRHPCPSALDQVAPEAGYGFVTCRITSVKSRRWRYGDHASLFLRNLHRTRIQPISSVQKSAASSALTFSATNADSVKANAPCRKSSAANQRSIPAPCKRLSIAITKLSLPDRFLSNSTARSHCKPHRKSAWLAKHGAIQ